MGIIFEIILGLFEVIIGAVGEILLELIGQILIELGLHSLSEVFKSRPKRNPFFAFIGYTLFGFMVGGLSLLIFKKSLIVSPELKLLNLCITPFLGGITMSLIGRLRSKKGQDLIRLDSFGYGFTFALGVAIIRYFFVN